MKNQQEYYDILILGRAGWGKKTLLDKLVGADDGTLRRDWLEQTNDDACKQLFRIVSNKQSIRVTIAPGFGNFSNDTEVNSVCDRNVGSVRLIFKLQRELKISFKRVVYFLPFRGPPGRADGYLKDELKCLWNFYGERIFRCMVMIATNSPDAEYQEIGFSESFQRKSKSVVEHVLSEVSGVHSATCPPIAYLSLSCTSENALDIVQNCAITDEKPLVPSDAKRCVKCASLIFDGFKCHPKFIYILPGDSMLPQAYKQTEQNLMHRYSSNVKTAENALGPYVLGTLMLRPLKWSDDFYKCMHCGKDYGTEGCLQIEQVFKYGDDTGEIVVKHEY